MGGVYTHSARLGFGMLGFASSARATRLHKESLCYKMRREPANRNGVGATMGVMRGVNERGVFFLGNLPLRVLVSIFT